ncbi:GIY-YIG nuclease family protein [Shimazuella alba]|jgi:putative endonuclease|uniref:GIY-YIG nuclease family protein n=1 Tax=Shimazuella alba TaxID=2690964 RepID=A0A6I4W2F8_9BACL|nr:GIY-YIG nuclease family protein [Shimazuella alba]MXQ54492.1 GIY-YIG nuclease family protein [Shimazuella alba]
MYIVYILECSDRTYYTGITNKLEARLKQHQLGKASKYTRSRLPIKLVYQEPALDKSHALRRELEVKSWSRTKKQQLIQTYVGESQNE